MTPTSPHNFAVKNYTVIRLSGHAKYYKHTDYFKILDEIYVEYLSAGSQWDRPNILLMEGKVVIPEDLAAVAWNYGTRLKELTKIRDAIMRQEFQPLWLVTEPTTEAPSTKEDRQ